MLSLRVILASLRGAFDRVPGRRLCLAGTAVAFAGLGLGGCAQRPQEVAVSHGKEYFPSSIYGRASPRVIADGQPIPRGGGQYLVGKPYTIAGRTYYPSESRRTVVGNASWYGDAFHGRLTANGEIYDRDSFTAASPTLPLPSYARLTNLRNNYSMIVRVNDRGPYASDRVMDVSRRVAEALDYKRYGTTKLRIEYVGRASLDGSDDTKLYATLRTNGPARWEEREPTMVAEAAPPVRVASIAPYAPRPPRRVIDEEREQREAEVERPLRHRAAHVETEERRYPVLKADDLRQRGRESRKTLARRDEGESVQPRFTEKLGRASTPHLPLTVISHSYEARGRDVPSRSHPSRLAEAEPRQLALHHVARPPSRPMDLGTIPGAASQIRARHETSRQRTARLRDE